MKKVITYGSFDLFHEGHYRLLKRAKELGDYLIVGVTTEQFDEYRGKINVVDSLMERIENVKKSGFADQIIIEDHVGQKVEDIQKYKVDIFTVGSDWAGKFDYIRKYCDVVYLERTNGVSSTMLRYKEFGIVRLGVIGAGRIAKRFVPEVKYVSGVNAQIVYNRSLEHAKQLATENELTKYTDRLDELYEAVDAVYIATPHLTHYPYIKDALLHGKHVLCEKPMVLKEEQAREVFAIAREKKLVLMEAVKTAYAPGFINLVSMVTSGSIGAISDVTGCFTKLETPNGQREFLLSEAGGSFLELGTYPLLAIIKTLGHDIRDVAFTSFLNADGVDMYTKADLYYDNAVAQVKVGLGVKTEGALTISGSKGYLLAESPWWLTKKYELRYEDPEANEEFFFKFLGQGLRYEIGAFVSRINGYDKYQNCLTEQDSVAFAGIMEKYLDARKNGTIRVLPYHE